MIPAAHLAYRGRMRTLTLSMIAAAAAAACGGSKAAAPATTPPPTPAPTALGTSGFPGLDWGATMPQVMAIYPAATGDEALSFQTTHGGEAAHVHLNFTDGALDRISVSFESGFESMGACSRTFESVRDALAPGLGESSEENLAAYWDGAGYSAVLSCGISDGDAAELSMSYSRPE